MIDWEAACWGHPYEDLAYFCFPFHFPAELEVLPTGKVGRCSPADLNLGLNKAMLSQCDLCYPGPLCLFSKIFALITLKC